MKHNISLTNNVRWEKPYMDDEYGLKEYVTFKTMWDSTVCLSVKIQRYRSDITYYYCTIGYF